MIEELNRQIYERSVQTPSMQRVGSNRLSRRDASVWGWTDGSALDTPASVRGGKEHQSVLTHMKNVVSVGPSSHGESLERRNRWIFFFLPAFTIMGSFKMRSFEAWQ